MLEKMFSLEYLRSAYAVQCLNGRYGQATSVDGESNGAKLKEYRSVILSAGIFLRQCGMLQLAAFYLSKRDAERAVLKDIFLWLLESPVSREIFSGVADISAQLDRPELMTMLLGFSSGELALLEREAEQILGRLKQLTEAIYQPLKKKQEKTDERQNETADAERTDG